VQADWGRGQREPPRTRAGARARAHGRGRRGATSPRRCRGPVSQMPLPPLTAPARRIGGDSGRPARFRAGAGTRLPPLQRKSPAARGKARRGAAGPQPRRARPGPATPAAAAQPAPATGPSPSARCGRRLRRELGRTASSSDRACTPSAHTCKLTWLVLGGGPAARASGSSIPEFLKRASSLACHSDCVTLPSRALRVFDNS